MTTSLSILLPVHNAEFRLVANITDILELAGELVDRFEILILDEGSSDRTLEVASEIAMQYPQVDVVRHNVRRGLAAVIKTGLSRTSGDLVIVHNGIGPVNVSEIHRLWQVHDRTRGETGVMAGQHSRSRFDRYLRGLSDREQLGTPRTAVGSFHLLDRRSVVPRAKAERGRRREIHAGRLAPHHRAESPIVARPNFLSRLKQFALDE